MLIIGEKYKFIEVEIKRLKKYNLEYVKIDTNLVNNIKEKLKTEKYKFLILNTNKPLSNDILRYLVFLELQGIQFLTIEHFLEKYLGKTYIPEDNSNISFLDDVKAFSKWKYFLKRIIDFSIIIPLVIFTFPIMCYSVYRIKKESPDGPIFFKQKRIGLNGQQFECIKFRSMKTDIEFFDHYTQANDPRIFPWGNTMRKARIDELPQIWNVIKGEMHMIGPRAEWNKLVKKYEKKWVFYHERHLIAPGITGWAQINYPYGQNIHDTYQKLMYDLYYIKNWNILLELKTIFKTILIIISKKGL